MQQEESSAGQIQVLPVKFPTLSTAHLEQRSTSPLLQQQILMPGDLQMDLCHQAHQALFRIFSTLADQSTLLLHSTHQETHGLALISLPEEQQVNLSLNLLSEVLQQQLMLTSPEPSEWGMPPLQTDSWKYQVSDTSEVLSKSKEQEQAPYPEDYISRHQEEVSELPISTAVMLLRPMPLSPLSATQTIQEVQQSQILSTGHSALPNITQRRLPQLTQRYGTLQTDSYHQLLPQSQELCLSPIQSMLQVHYILQEIPGSGQTSLPEERHRNLSLNLLSEVLQQQLMLTSPEPSEWGMQQPPMVFLKPPDLDTSEVSSK